MSASGTDRQIARPNGPDFSEARRTLPDVKKTILPDVPAGQRKLNARVNVSMGRDVAGRMARAAWRSVENIVVDRARRRGERGQVAYQGLSFENFSEIFPADIQIEDGAVAVEMRRDRGIDRKFRARFPRHGLHTLESSLVRLHQDAGDHDVNAPRAQQPDSPQRFLKRARDFGDRIVYLRHVRIHADLHLMHAKLRDARRFLFTDQQGVRLELDIEAPEARVFDDREKVLAQKDLSAAEGQEHGPRVRHLIEQVAQFGQTQLGRVVVIEIAVDTSLVAAPGQIDMYAERNGHVHGATVQRFQKSHGLSWI